MSYIASVYLNNWMRFQGEHHVKLGPSVYAVTARMESNEERSNWLGKSSFLRAIRFALTGTKPKELEHEDDWITWGEKTGSVCVVLDNGFSITRERARGRATQLRVVDAAGHQASQSAAQDAIDAALGLTESDLMATSILEQKKMGRFVSRDTDTGMTAGGRMEVITPWLDLEKLRNCEENTRTKLTKMAKREKDIANELRSLGALRANALQPYAKEADGALSLPDEAELAKIVAKLKRVRDKLEKAAAKAQEIADEHADNLAHAEKAAEYEQLVEKGKKLRAHFDQIGIEVLKKVHAEDKAKLKQVGELLATSKDGLKRLKQVAQGAFDGNCPVAGIECPATDRINTDRKAARKRYEAEKKVNEKLSADYERSENEFERAGEELAEAEAMEQHLGELRERAMKLQPSYELVQREGPFDRKKLAQLREDANEKIREFNAAEIQYESARTAAESVKQWNAKAGTLTKDGEKLRSEMTTAREALVIFGANGAQRQIAEGALADIQRGANRLLRDAGIDLAIEVKWGHEGKKLATYCTSCGAPFPTSQRVKECEQCGAVRGPHIIEHLHTKLSEYSGAAEDLAGLAFQLSASAWLRARRTSAWSVLIADEPFSALDAANKRALATQFASMLRGMFSQSFVVAHDKGIMDGLPAQLRVIADEEKSWLEVENETSG